NGHYTASNAISENDGIVELTVYGYAAAGGSLPATSSGANPCVGSVPKGGTERLVNVDLRQIGFLNYLELTDLQLVDEDWLDQQWGYGITDCKNGTTTNGNTTTTYSAYYYDSQMVTINNSTGVKTTTPITDCGPLDNYWVT